jgi:hypothetical protein
MKVPAALASGLTALASEFKRSERQADHLSSANAKVNNKCKYTSILPSSFRAFTCTSFYHCAPVLVSVGAHQEDSARSAGTHVTSYHQNNLLGNSSDPSRSGRQYVDGRCRSILEGTSPTFLAKLRMRRCIYNLRVCLIVFLSSSFFSLSLAVSLSLSLTSILSPSCEYGHHVIPLQ